MSKKIVIISNYYPPEMGAAANRIKNLAIGLKNHGNSVTVIAPLPNYPKGKIFDAYKNKFSTNEILDDVRVKRFWIFPSTSKNPILRLLSMLSFAFTLWFSFFSILKQKPDTFIIQSPPLLVALSGLLFTRLQGKKPILNVSDIWPLSALELGVIKKGVFYNFLELIERVNYKLAGKIIGQSNEIITHINKIVHKKTLVYRNVPAYKNYKIKKKNIGNVKIVYAGLLGYAQGILEICERFNFKELGVEFHIYGAGMDDDKIKIIADKQNKNIFFHGSKSYEQIKKEILKYDVGFVPLKTTIYGAVPSKIFELMQLGLPILFVGSGEASALILEYNLGLISFPNDYDLLKDNILKFKKMKNENFSNYSKNCINIHKEKYNVEYQLKKVLEYI